MYSQAPSELPNGYSGSAFSHEPIDLPCPDEESASFETGALPEKRRARGLYSILDRFRIGRYLKGIDLEDLLILTLALLLLLEDGEDDLFPLLLLLLLLE